MKRLFASILKEVLAPSGIQVSVEKFALTVPPDADIIVCRRDDESLSDVIRDMLLADGLRDNTDPYIMIKFHNTEDLNVDTFRKTLAYAHIHYVKRELKYRELHSFLIITAKLKMDILTDVLNQLSFEQTDKQGVYRSHAPLSDTITVIVLDEMVVEPHNMMLKSFSN